MHIAIDRAVNIGTGAGLALAQLLEEIIMKLQLNKLMAGLVMAGGVVALVGCGGGGEPELQTKINVQVSPTDTKAITAAANIAAALDEVAVPLSTTAATALKVPGATTLTFTGPAPAGTVGGIATAKITAGAKSLITTVRAGSCKFKVTGPANAAERINDPLTNLPYAIDDPATTTVDEAAEITVDPCAFSTANLTGLSSTPVKRTVTITIGTATVTSEVEATSVNGVVKFNGKDVATQSATGSISF